MISTKEFEFTSEEYLAPGEKFSYEGDDYVIISILNISFNWMGKATVKMIVAHS